MRGFASDNNAAVHPEVLAALAAANVGHALAYGDDPLTAAAVSRFRDHLGPDVEVFFTFNGTGANVTGLQALLRSYEAVVCASTAHINSDEAGAPEKLLGSKLVDLPTPDGKLTPDQVAQAYVGIGDQHHVQAKVVSVTQTTELGTVYSRDELSALAEAAHSRGMWLHVDGARISNAAVSLGCTLREVTGEVGVDVLSFGGTKNGLLGGEAVVFFRPELARSYRFWRKQSMQLSSKMRYVAAQFVALLSDDLWQRNAGHANAMARLLADRVSDVPGVTVTQPVQANAVFARLPAAAVPVLQEHAFFYVWDDPTHEVRWMCSWDTTDDDVGHFADAVARVVPPLT